MKRIILVAYLLKFAFCVPVDVINNVDENTNQTDAINNLEEKPILLIISYDGFRNEYLRRNVTPNMLDFRENGTYADYMKNVFPTKTFTNHHSIATGLYPDKHGVLANSLYDTEQGPLKYSYNLFHFNSDAVPIWVLNQQNGGKSACIMWPGSDFEYNNITCTYVMKYNTSVPLRERVDIMIKQLTEDEPPNLVMLYFEQPDKLAHMVGPDSQNMTELVATMDNLTKYIQDQLTENNLINRTNVIHLSDHGMAGTSEPFFINITDYLEPNSFKYYGTSPVLQIVPEDLGQLEDIYQRLKNASEEDGNFKIYLNKDIEERWHANNTRRFGPIIAVANDGYAFNDMYAAAEHYRNKSNVPFTVNSTYGVHGYDNDDELMHSYFMAKGPHIKSHHKIEPFESVDLYPLFMKLLQIDESKMANYETDGDYSRVADILSSTESKFNLTNIIIASLLAVLVVVLLIVYIVHQMKKRKAYNVT